MRTWTRRTLWLATALVIGGGGLSTVWWLRSRPAPPPVYATRPVSRATVTRTVLATGVISPRVSVEVGAQVSGRIVELDVDFNQSVREGQRLARLDPQFFEAEVARAEANLEAAEAAVTKARAEAANARVQSARLERLAGRGLTSEVDREAAATLSRTTRAQLALARAGLAQTQAALASARTNLGYTTITSPIDGVVISRDVEVGQTVAASLAAPTLFTLAGNLEDLEVHTDVAESDVGLLAPGQQVLFAVDAFPAELFDGRVKEVRYAPKTVQNVVTYDAVVVVSEPELRLRPGMTAEVTFVVEAHQNVLVVSNAALRFVPPDAPLDPGRATGASTTNGRVRQVWRPGPDGTPESVRVLIGISDGRVTEILEGLEEGDAVITGVGDEDAGENERPARPQRRPFRIL